MPDEIGHRLTPRELALFNGKVSRGGGCKKCNKSGYHGRLGFFELVMITPALRRAISENRPVAELTALTDESFMTMREDGLQKASKGLTTVEEVMRATQDTDDSGV